MLKTSKKITHHDYKTFLSNPDLSLIRSPLVNIHREEQRISEVLFIEPKENGHFYKNPMHLQYLAGSVEESLNISVNLLDLNIAEDVERLEHLEPQLIVISTPHGSIQSVKDIVTKYSRTSFILIGEIVTDGLSSEFLSVFSGSDVISIPSYAENELINHVKKTYGITSKPLRLNIQESPKALFTKQIVNKYLDSGFQLFIHGISRGCEEKCTFCRLNNRKETSGVVNNIDYLSTVETLSDIASLAKENIYIQFSDENFFGGKSPSDKAQRLTDIIKLSDCISSDKKFGNVRFGVDTRIDTIYNAEDTKELSALRRNAWAKFISSGLKYTYIGLESVSKTQIKRYGKRFTPEKIMASVSQLNQMDIDYTLGLIIFDPLTTVEEVKENIDFIKDNNLYGNVASLLKEIRVEVKSPYYKLMKVKSSQDEKITNFLYCNQGSIKFTDDTIQNMMPIIREVSQLFRGSGYRHSDLSRIYNLTDDNLALNIIPSIVIKLEIEIIELLISRNFTLFKNMEKTNNILSAFIKEVHIIISAFEANSKNEKKVRNYYLSVFKEIESSTPINLTSQDVTS